MGPEKGSEMLHPMVEGTECVWFDGSRTIRGAGLDFRDCENTV